MLKKMSRKAKLIWGGVIVLVLVGILGSCGSGGDKATDTVPTPTAAAEGFTLPDYSGKKLKAATEELTAAGIKFESTDIVNDKMVLDPANWDVESHTPAAGTVVAKGDTVTFNVSKPGAAEAKAEADKAAAEKALEPTAISTGLEATYAQAACDTYAEKQFPFGVKMHWIVGRLAEEIQDDQWFLKVEATVTNEYGAKQKGVNVECFVGGTNDAPVVNVFNAY